MLPFRPTTDILTCTQFIIGTSLVMLATWLYSASDRTIHRPPPIHIASFEKPAIDIDRPAFLTPRTKSSNRLNLAAMEHDIGLTTSRPSSPMLPRQPSRTNIKRDF